MPTRSATARTVPGGIFASRPVPEEGAGLPAYQERGYPAAANAEPRGEAALLDIIRRALDGDPFPVSGGGSAARPGDETLADKIRGILNHDQSLEELSADAESGGLGMPARLPAAVEQATGVPTPAALEREEEDALVPIGAPLAEVPSFELPQPELQPRRIFGRAAIAFVACAAILGAAAPALVLDGSPRFAAEARLQARADIPSGWLDAIAKRIGSPHSLTQAVAKLKLDHDPEFTSKNTGVWTVASELLFGNEGASDAPSRAQAALSDAVSVDADAGAGALRLSVTTGSGEKSARIANLLADAAVYDAMIAEGAESTGTKAAGAALDRATAALDVFTRENGAERIKAATDLQRQRKNIDAEIAATRQAVATAREKVAATQSTRLGDLIDGSFDGASSSPALDDLRQRYVAAQAALSQLSVNLGPRHPRLIAQKAAVDGLTASMRAELRRLATAADAELAAAVTEEKRLSDRMAALGKQSAGIDLARLGQLQSDVETTRAAYEASTARTAKPVGGGEPLSVVTPAVGMAVVDSGLLPLEAAGFLLGFGVSALCVVGYARRRGTPRGGNAVAEVAVGRQEAAPEARVEPLEIAADEMPLAPISAAHIEPENRTVADIGQSGQDLALVRHDMTKLRAKLEAYASQRARRGVPSR
ncbi:hypothetical protein [Rhizobium sp. RAF56]|uniref:hypothetical protein n=1 Tax=Rhizobium sp. RAF56 TaxID=3233062 RepID=UPI003F98C242